MTLHQFEDFLDRHNAEWDATYPGGDMLRNIREFYPDDDGCYTPFGDE